jgi:hypothetical protein
MPVIDAEKLAGARGMVAQGPTVPEAAIRLRVSKTGSPRHSGSPQETACQLCAPLSVQNDITRQADDCNNT